MEQFESSLIGTPDLEIHRIICSGYMIAIESIAWTFAVDAAA